MHFMGHLIYTPLVTLHNPYNINLSVRQLRGDHPQSAGRLQFLRQRPAAEQPAGAADRHVRLWIRPHREILRAEDRQLEQPDRLHPSGQIVMKPGQTLVCGPYLNPDASFSDKKGTHSSIGRTT